ncbi:MAG: flagellar basal body P-ring formation protein FlgA [Calditrichaeota bacterium]|nr:flagellar basal body P-ring formation protein FlgA [Calditrichota bacterium]MCB9368798.1 flagellar basal body P-ring formation protein FlgA [Calditrichota bacterium]
MKLGWLFTLCLITNMAVAQDYTVLERLIALSWQPHEVSCTWMPIFGDPARLNELTNIEPSAPIESCSYGIMTVTLTGTDTNGEHKRVTFKGKARIFGQAFSVASRVKIGEKISGDMLASLTCEWSSLRTTALLDRDAIIGKLAVRPLIPGRAILATDVRPRPVIQSGDPVTIMYERNGVTVKVDGIAMKEGGVGEKIPVRVPEVDKNRLVGVIQDDATLRWIP